MDLKDLKIDPEFAEKIPPLTEEEYTQLEANILAEGALLSPMIVWNGVIVDGHNRYRILQEHPEITFEVREKEFENRFEAIAWICRNQLGRRNLTEIQKRMLIGKQYEAEKAIHGFNETAQTRDENGHFRRSGQNDQSGEGETTRQRIARENGVSDSYVRHAADHQSGRGGGPGFAGRPQGTCGAASAAAKVPRKKGIDKGRARRRIPGGRRGR